MPLRLVRSVRWLSVLFLVSACGGGDPAGPEPEPDPVRHETARFVILDYATTAQDVIDALGARLESEFDRVGVFLPEFSPPPTPVTMNVLAGGGIPFVSIGQNSINQWGDDLAPEYLPHQLTHLYTRYARTNFIEEGLAVYVSEELRLTGELPNPYRAQPPHAWVSLFEQHNSTISLFTSLRVSNLSYSYSGSSPDASAWQVFVQAGSFTRWLIETHGRAQWFEFYLTANIGGVLGQDTPDIEREWLTVAKSTFPTPLAYEEALVRVGSREEFWCNRARGG